MLTVAFTTGLFVRSVILHRTVAACAQTRAAENSINPITMPVSLNRFMVHSFLAPLEMLIKKIVAYGLMDISTSFISARLYMS
jgi:hypothetical protein